MKLHHLFALTAALMLLSVAPGWAASPEAAAPAPALTSATCGANPFAAPADASAGPDFLDPVDQNAWCGSCSQSACIGAAYGSPCTGWGSRCVHISGSYCTDGVRCSCYSGDIP